MKLDIIMHYEVDETTGEIKFIGKDEITVDTAAKKTSTTKKAAASKVDNNPEPLITLEASKLVLTQGAVDALNPCEDCRIDIKYKKRSDNNLVPVIGTDAAFGTKAGNKLTKSNTVSYRGAANDKLAAYGTVFKLEPTEEDGIFFMIGDKNPAEPEPPKELVDIESELDIPSLDDLANSDDTELGNFDFNL